MGEIWEEIKDAAKDTIDAVTSLPPMPERQPECDYFLKFPKQAHDGVTWYWVDGGWVEEPQFKKWFFEKQIDVVDKKIAAVNAKIKPYQDEIDRIEMHLAGKEHAEDAEDIQEASLRKRIDTLTEELRKVQGEGLIPTDVEYRNRLQQIKNLQEQLSTKTPSYESTWHITDWPVQPGGQTVPNQDLYVLLTLHKKTIERIAKFERKPLEVQRERNDAHMEHWQDKMDEKNE